MTVEALVLDEGGILLPPDTKDATGPFNALSGLLDTIRGHGFDRRKRSTIYYVEVLPGLTLCDLLFQADAHHLDDDLRSALIVQIDSLAEWDEGDVLTSREYVIDRLVSGECVANVVLRPNQEVLTINRKGRSYTLHAIGDESSLVAFYRDAPEIGDFSAGDFMGIAGLAYPELIFKPGLAAEFSRFNEGYRAIRKKVARVFEVLNDSFFAIRAACGEDAVCIQRRFRAASGFDVSPESPLTHRKRNIMRFRDVTVNGHVVRCEWHVKLQPHVDRIHFAYGRPEFPSTKIVIGIFTDHLPV